MQKLINTKPEEQREQQVWNSNPRAAIYATTCWEFEKYISDNQEAFDASSVIEFASGKLTEKELKEAVKLGWFFFSEGLIKKRIVKMRSSIDNFHVIINSKGQKTLSSNKHLLNYLCHRVLLFLCRISLSYLNLLCSRIFSEAIESSASSIVIINTKIDSLAQNFIGPGFGLDTTTAAGIGVASPSGTIETESVSISSSPPSWPENLQFPSLHLNKSYINFKWEVW